MIRTRVLTLAGTLMLAVPLAFSHDASAQEMGHDMGHMDRHGPGGPEDGGGMDRRGGHGMGILPPGAWWKNPEMVKMLGLSPDQQKHMDDIMLQSRLQLIQMKASLEEEQVKLEPLLNTNPVDEKVTLAQISKIADLRANLEKANAKTLLGLRGILTADQWTKLQNARHQRREEWRNDRHNDMRGPQNPPQPPAGGGPGEE